MKRVGIKVWVLTGDKIGTAKKIGIAAGLLDQMMMIHDIHQDGVNELLSNL